MKAMTIYAPAGMLGYGIPERSFELGMSLNPDVLAVDAGSTDPGPYYLGSGTSFTNRDMVKRDLTLILRAAHEERIPVIIGSAGGGGAKPHLRWLLEIIDEVNGEQGLKFPTAAIPGDVDRDLLKKRIADGAVKSLDHDIPLTPSDVDEATQIVAQMGAEPVIAALDRAQLIVCGRASDPAIMAAPAIARGYPVQLAVHMGKILECGAAAAYPRHGTDGLLGTIHADHFTVEPANPDQVCTVDSVAAHTLYERSDPVRSSWPGGTLDLSEVHFEQQDERTVRLSGARYEQGDDYWVKVEGARRAGYRTITIAGARDPLLLNEIDTWERNVRERVALVAAPLIEGVDYRLVLHIYGRDGVMGATEPTPTVAGHEIGIVIEVVAPTEKVSRRMLAVARSAALHSTYPDRKGIAGNLAFPFSPSDIPAGDVYEFSIYHLMRLDNPLEIFPIHVGESASKLALIIAR